VAPPVPLPPTAPWRGMGSIDMTIAFGIAPGIAPGIGAVSVVVAGG
jgi:hypothetical protein